MTLGLSDAFSPPEPVGKWGSEAYHQIARDDTTARIWYKAVAKLVEHYQQLKKTEGDAKNLVKAAVRAAILNMDAGQNTISEGDSDMRKIEAHVDRVFDNRWKKTPQK